MKKDKNVSEVDGKTLWLMEDAMELTAVQPASNPTRTKPCTHSRAIDNVLTRGKKRTGKVRCLECGTIFDDPTVEYR
jgi:hypothetical protein